MSGLAARPDELRHLSAVDHHNGLCGYVLTDWAIGKRVTNNLADPPRGNLELSAAKEALSRAYVHAVIAAAGCISAKPEPDYDKVDLTVRQTADHLQYANPCVDLQLKATAQDIRHGDHLSFSLPADDYNALCDDRLYNARILVVVTLPGDPLRWLFQHDRAMLMRHCGYWVSLKGQPPTNQGSKTVLLPLSQKFDVKGLCGLLQRIGDGEAP